MNFLKIISTDYATLVDNLIPDYFSIFFGYFEGSPKSLVGFLSF